MTGRVPHLVARLQGLGTTIFSEMSALAVDHDAVNLGQGAPDFSGPDEIIDAAIAAMRAGRNQYAPGHGVATLRTAIAEHQTVRYGLDFDVDREITVAAGATEAMTATILALAEVGDEVVVFEPYYDSTVANIAMAGAVRRAVPLEPPHWTFDPDRLEAAVTPRTRAIVVNTPHNPSGTVFSRDQLEQIAHVCRRHDLLAITDEVYEHLVFDDHEHVPLATLEGMRERTVTISSGGKTFSLTGWKIGWICAPADLTAAIRTAKQFLSFSNNTPGQFGIAHGLGLGDAYFKEYVADYTRRRERLVGGLRNAGFDLETPQGTYFAVLDARQLGSDDGMALCRRMPREAGVAAIPVVALVDDEPRYRSLIRLAFCKNDDAIDEGVARLAAIRETGGSS